MATLGELVLLPTPPYMLELAESREVSLPIAFTDLDGDGVKDKLVAIDNPAFPSSLLIIPGSRPERRAEQQLRLPGDEIVGKLSALMDARGQRLIVATTVDDSLARIGIQKMDSTGWQSWVDVMLTPIGTKERRERIYPMADVASLAPDSIRVIIPVFGNYNSWRGAIVVDPNRPEERRLFPNGLGLTRMTKPFPGPGGKQWVACGRGAAQNGIRLGGWDDLNARLHGFDADSGFTSTFDLTAHKVFTYELIPGTSRLLVLGWATRSDSVATSDSWIWDAAAERVVWQSRMNSGIRRILRAEGSLFFAGEDKRIWEVDSSGIGVRPVGHLPSQDSRNILAFEGGWLLADATGAVQLLDFRGRLLAAINLSGKPFHVAIEGGTRLEHGASLLICFERLGQRPIVSSFQLTGVSFAQRAIANPLFRWSLALAGMAFLLLLASRLSLQETLMRKVIQPGSRSVGIFDSRGRLVYENPQFAEELHDVSHRGALLNLLRSKSTRPLRLEAGSRRVIWKRREYQGKTGGRTWTILEGEDVSLERENEQQRLFLAKLAVMAHDLKSPLTPIQMQADVLETHLKSLPEQDRAAARLSIDAIHEGVERSLSLIQRFMNMARIEFQTELVSLPAVIHGAIADCRKGYGAGIEFTTDWENEQVWLTQAEPEVLQLVLLELLQNAVQAMDGRGAIRISLSRRSQGGIALSLCDTGPGIAADRLDKVWEPGYTTRERGTGFGLYFVKRVLEQQGIGITMNTQEAGGLRIVLDFAVETNQAPTRDPVHHSTRVRS